tara:strand:- start:334 stop:801 length:468 start_codon:yes stop_codon:yes gene_type:complete
MVSIGGLGFLLASISSYLGKDLLPLGHPASLIFIPQGLVMGIYGLVASLLSIYIWTLININFGSGKNIFNKETEKLLVTRRAILKEINVEIPLKDIKAVKLEVRDGINPLRRVCLRIKGRKDLPLTGVGKLMPLDELEESGAKLARFLGVNIEGL